MGMAFQENEFNWVLKNEVHNSLKELTAILSDCISKFPMALCGLEKGAEVEKFVLNTPSTTPPEQVRIKLYKMYSCRLQKAHNKTGQSCGHVNWRLHQSCGHQPQVAEERKRLVPEHLH